MYIFLQSTNFLLHLQKIAFKQKQCNFKAKNTSENQSKQTSLYILHETFYFEKLQILLIFTKEILRIMILLS